MEKRREKKGRILQINNAGSAIVTVIVVVAFVSILATTILYVSGMNFYMKMTDLKTKVSFYEAETALEEIKALLEAEVSRASAEAYTETMINYAASEGSVRAYQYQNRFLSILQDNFAARTKDPANPDITLYTYSEVLQSIAAVSYTGEGLTAPTVACSEAGIEIKENYAVLSGVTLSYTDAEGYVTEITTDYVIKVPQIEWSVDRAETTWTDGDVVGRKTVDMADCVQYYNWIKK